MTRRSVPPPSARPVAPPPALTIEQSAAKLPAPKIGKSVTVPLMLWPAYQALHRLEVVSCDKKTCALTVRRMVEGAKP